jgi:hypothetical protein
MSLTFISLIVATDHKKHAREDGKIEAQNKKLRAAQQMMIKHQEKVNQISSSNPSAIETLAKATKTLEKSTKTFKNAVEVSRSLIGTGSGKAPLLLPAGSMPPGQS